MDYRVFGDKIALRLDPGEELLDRISEVCRRQGVRFGSITGIGAANHVTIGFYNLEKQEYSEKDLDFPMEITSILGDVSRKDGEVYLHVHINVSDEEGRTFGGHLKKCMISVTGEIVITCIDGEVGRKADPATGINVLSF